MKKLVCLLAVIALAAPLYAAVGDPNIVISCVDDVPGTGVCRIDYQVLDEDGLGSEALVRGFALEISVGGNATIDDEFDAIWGYAADGLPGGDAYAVPEGYSIYISNIQFDTVDPNLVSDWGDPIAEISGDKKEMIVELASLYDMDTGTPPGQSGTLFKFPINFNGDASTTVSITAEPLRGGIVMEEPGDEGDYGATIVPQGCTISGEPLCFPTAGIGGITAYNDWRAFRRPACWCNSRQCHGDANGAYEQAGAKIWWVGAADTNVITQAWKVKEPPKGSGIKGVMSTFYPDVPIICADFDHTAEVAGAKVWRVGAQDITAMTAWWKVKEPPKGSGVPADCPL